MSAYLISSTNSPIFPKNHECKAIKPNFTNITDCLRSKAKNSNNNKNLYRKTGKMLGSLLAINDLRELIKLTVKSDFLLKKI